MKRRTSAALLTLLMVIATLSVQTARAEACAPLDVGPPGCVVVRGWSSVVDHESLTFYRLPAVARFFDPVGDEWAAAFVPYCEGNVSGTTFIADGMCIRAEVTCELRGSAAVIALWMRLTAIPGSPPRMEGPVCFNGSSKVALGPIIQAQAEDAIGAAPPPITLQPLDAIVNLASIASTDPRQKISIVINDPVAGVITATPSFAWDFGDGGGGIGPGVPYDGTSPRQDPGHYVAHTYRALGTPTVGLTVTWDVTFAMPGYPPIQLEDVLRQATTTTTIRQASSQLIGG